MDLILHGYDSQTVPKLPILPAQAGFSTQFFCDFMSAAAQETVFEIFLEIVSTSAMSGAPSCE
jgi:cellobiose-specific phosphotransferase system component IIB